MATRALATAFVNIVPGTADLESYLRGKLASDVGAAGVPAGEQMAKGVAGGFGSKVGGFFKPLLAGMAVSFGAIGISRFVGDMYSSAVEGQKVDAVLGQVASSMNLFGGETGSVVDRLKDFATQQMKLTGIDDDVIKGAQAKLLTFKELASSADEAGGMFDRATKISADMAAVFGGDASSQAVVLGKAMNDPVKGIASLSRVGVQFTDDQKAMIAGMVEAGDMAGAQAIIMKELETQVGGTAEASATAGEKMKARWDDAIQSLGTSLMPVFEGIIGFLSDTVVPAFENAGDGVKAFLGWFGDNQGWLLPVLSGLSAILLSIGIYTTALGVASAIAAAGGLPAIITATWLWTAALLANPVTWIIIGIGLLIGALVLLAMNWETVTAWVSDVWSSFTTWLSDSFTAIGEWWGDLWTGIQTFVQGVWTGIVNWFKGALQWLVNLFLNWTLLGQIIKNWDAITKAFTGAWNGIVSWFSGAIDTFVRGWETAWQGMSDFIGDVFKNIVGFVKAPLNAIIGLINSAINAVNSIKVDIPDWVPGIGGGTLGFHLPNIPKLAAGGFVTQPTTALIGEAGPEVVTPLKDFERMLGLDGSAGKTIIYNAAPNQSLSSDQALFDAMRRAKVLAGW